MKFKARLRLKWARFIANLKFIAGLIWQGEYICEGCGDFIDRKAVIEHIWAGLTREEMDCKACLREDDYPEEDYEVDEDFPPYGEEPYEDDMWVG